MIITTTYRGNRVEVVNSNSHAYCQPHSVAIETNWQSGRKTHIVEIQAGDLLQLAKQCCKKISEISGVEYRVFARAPSSHDWSRI